MKTHLTDFMPCELRAYTHAVRTYNTITDTGHYHISTTSILGHSGQMSLYKDEDTDASDFWDQWDKSKVMMDHKYAWEGKY